MKKTIVALVLISIGAMLQANEATALTSENCSRAAKVAESLMRARQRGVALQDALDALKSSYPKSAHGYVEKLVIMAYDVPLYASPDYQTRAVGEFRDKAHLQCLKAK